MNMLPTLLCLAAALLSSGAAFAGATPITIPEPSGLALMVGGIAAAALLKFRRK